MPDDANVNILKNNIIIAFPVSVCKIFIFDKTCVFEKYYLAGLWYIK